MVGVDDAMNFVMWVKLFIEQQVAGIQEKLVVKKLESESVIQQDNTSTIRLENNGKRLSMKRTSRIDIRYFCVASKVKNGDVSIVYHQTKEMVSDYLTKLLQGSPFRSHRNSIMGVDEVSPDKFEKEYAAAKTRLKAC